MLLNGATQKSVKALIAYMSMPTTDIGVEVRSKCHLTSIEAHMGNGLFKPYRSSFLASYDWQKVK
jgi:hypothetical protein